MKYLLILISLFATLSLRAQTTNVTVTIRVVDGSGTNSFPLPASALHILGWNASYESFLAVPGNSSTFPLYVKTNVIQRLDSLVELGRSYQVRSNKLDTIATQLPAIYPTMTVQDQQALADLWKKYVP